MKLSNGMKANDRGHLEIGGCDTVELVSEFGTPLYVVDEQRIRDNCREYLAAFREQWLNSAVVYAGKAFCTMAMCRLVDEENLGLDVVSGGELYTAIAAKFPPERIYFHGNNKSAAELEMGLEKKVGRFVVDNLFELELLNELAKQHKVRAKILLRVSPGVDAHTHSYIKTGIIDSKFGLIIDNEQALWGIKKALGMKYVELKGIHCHIGSQILELEAFVEAANKMMAFINKIKLTTGTFLEELNLGGGLGIKYTEADASPSPKNFALVLCQAVKAAAEKYKLPLPRLVVEPGRSIVGAAGCTLYTIGSIKDIPGIRKYVAVDGGMTDNPRPALYQSKYEAVIANKLTEKNVEVVSVAGRCCESGDMLLRDIALPKVASGDILAVLSTGAYNYAMASNYNRNPIPAVVFVRNGLAAIVVKRQSYADLVVNDVIPLSMYNKKADLA